MAGEAADRAMFDGQRIVALGQRVVALEEENARLCAELEAARAENVELQGMFARMRVEWIRQISKSLTKSE